MAVVWYVPVLGRGGSSGRAARLQPSLKNVREKIPPNGQTRLKFGFSYEILQHYHFRSFRHHFGSTLPRNPTKPMFRCFPMTPLKQWRLQHTCRWIWRFRAVFGAALKERNQTIVYKKHGGVSTYRNAFLLFWQWIFKEKILSWLFFTSWFSWILNFVIQFDIAFTSTLAILAALDTNLVDNLGLRKYSPSFICATVVYSRDERTVKFFSPSPILIRKSWIRSSPDLQNFLKSSARSSLDRPIKNHIFCFASWDKIASWGKIDTTFWHSQNLITQCYLAIRGKSTGGVICY